MRVFGRAAALFVALIALALPLAQPASAAGKVKPEECYAGIEETVARQCLLVRGRPGQPVVVLFGDSHAMRLSYGVAKVAEQHGFRLVLISKSGCPTPTVSLYTYRGDPYPQCAKWRQSALGLIESIRPTAVITHSTYLYGGFGMMRDSTGTPVPDESQAAIWEAGAATTLNRLREPGVPVLAIRGIPVIFDFRPVCLTPGANHRACGAALSDAVPQQARDFWAADSRQAQASGARTLDLSDRFCEDGYCSVWTKKGVARFSDGHHLTKPFAKTLYKPLAAGLQEVLPLAPSPVRSLRVTGKGRNATLRWKRPAVAGSAKVTEYRVSLMPRGSSNRRTAVTSCRTTATRCRIRERLSGDYRIRIRAISSVGASPQLQQDHRF